MKFFVCFCFLEKGHILGKFSTNTSHKSMTIKIPAKLKDKSKTKV